MTTFPFLYIWIIFQIPNSECVIKFGDVILTHVPVHTQELEYDGPFPPRYNIHGHVHEFSIEDERYFNASVDVNNWGPVKLEDILSAWNLPS